MNSFELFEICVLNARLVEPRARICHCELDPQSNLSWFLAPDSLFFKSDKKV